MKKIEKIIEYLIYLFIFLLPWQTRYIFSLGNLNGAVWEYGTISLYVTEILFGIIALLAIIFFVQKIKHKDDKYNKRISDLVFIILSLLVIALATVFTARNQQIALQGFTRLLEGVFLFFILLRININFKKISWAYVGATFCQSILAISQFLTQKVIGSKWLGMAEQLPPTGGVSVLETATERWLRAYGSFPHPNMLAGYLVIGLVLILGLLIMSANYRERGLLWLIAVFDFIALFFTFSKSAFLALLIGYVFTYIFLLLNRDYSSKQIFYQLALIGILVICVFSYFYSGLVSTRLAGTARLEVKSYDDRFNYFQQAQKIIEQNWLTGVGLGNFTLASYDLVTEKSAGYNYQPVHNIYILTLAECGVAGFLIFFGLIFYVIRTIYQYKIDYHTDLLKVFKEFGISDMIGDYSSNAYWFLILSAIILVIFTIGFFDHYFWTFYSGIMLFWLMLGLWSKQMKLNRI